MSTPVSEDTKTLSVVARMALEAAKARETARRIDQLEREERRKVEEAERDAEVMERVVNRSPLPTWFPGAEWVLVDRNLVPKDGAVVHPADDPSLLLRVTLTTYREVEPPQFIVALVESDEKGRGHYWEVARIREPADLGFLIKDAQRRASSLAVSE